jgi:hypothetical protein
MPFTSIFFELSSLCWENARSFMGRPSWFHTMLLFSEPPMLRGRFLLFRLLLKQLACCGWQNAFPPGFCTPVKACPPKTDDDPCAVYGREFGKETRKNKTTKTSMNNTRRYIMGESVENAANLRVKGRGK